MKQLLSLFLLLLPCLAWAQYPSNGNQKITLGEQTTADGLIWRGVLADTGIITPLSDTSAYIILDTVNHRFYNYNRATNVWSVAGGGTAVTSITGGTGLTGGTITTSGTLAADTTFLFTQSDTLGLNLTSRFAAKQNTLTLTTTGTSGASTLTGATLNIPQYSGGGGVATFSAGSTGLTPSTATSGAVTLGGTLAVANGGTNASTFTAGSVVFAGSGGTYTQDNSGLFWDNTNKRLGINQTILVDPLTVKRGNNNSWINFADTTSGFFKISNITSTSSITSPIFNIQAAGFFGSNISSAAGFYINKDSTVLGEDASDVVCTFDATKKKAKPGNTGRATVTLGTLFRFSNKDVSVFDIKASGRIGIGTESPTEALHVVGNTRISGLAGATSSRTVLADVNGVLSAPVSSINTKENVKILDYGLNELLQINPVSFDYINKDKWGDERNLGFIVEDMFPVIPEVTGTMNNGDMYLDMTKLIPVLTKAIQEQQAQIEALKQRIINLENK